MRMLRILILLFIVVPASAQKSKLEASREFAQRAVQAYKEKDYRTSAEYFERALKLRLDHPTLIYNLASVSALVGEPEKSIGLLAVLSRMGLIFRPEDDADFASMKGGSDFKSVLTMFENNRRPIGTLSVAYQFNRGDLIAEGLAYDSHTETTFIGSVRKREILALSKDGAISRFSSPSDSLMGVFGMKVDSKERALWVCTSSIEQMEGYSKELGRTASVYQYDLASRKPVRKYKLAGFPGAHIFGDLVVGPNGDVYVTDSVSPMIFVIRKGSERLELFLESGEFSSLQGIDFSPDRKRIIVADYARGLFVIDPMNKVATLLPQFAAATLLGIDALCSYEDGFIAVQNGVNPRRIVRLTLNKALTRVESFKVVCANQPELEDPTLGVVVGKEFLFNGNGLWDAFDEDGNPVSTFSLKKHVILRVPVN